MQKDFVREKALSLRRQLYMAIRDGALEQVKTLIEKGADVNTGIDDGSGYTPLHIAAQSKHVKACNLLIEAGAKVNVADGKGYTLLHIAAQDNSEEVCKLLIEAGAKVNTPDGDGYTPLNIAAYFNSREVAELLVEAGANVNKANNAGETPLSTAAWQEHVRMAKLLVRAGADPNIAGKRGHTPLFAAVRNDKLSSRRLARLFIEAGARVDIVNGAGETPLHFAVVRCETDIVKLLIEAGSDTKKTDDKSETADDSNETPSFFKKLAKLFVDTGAGVKRSAGVNRIPIVDRTNKDGQTPLHLAAAHRKTDVVKLLIEAGCDVNKADNEGRTPLFIASREGREDVAALLEEHGGHYGEKSKPKRKKVEELIFCENCGNVMQKRFYNSHRCA